MVALTGAGLSTASGIPDFRSPGGRWETYQPVPIQDFLARETAREEYWRYKGETWPLIRSAEPNPAHHAVVGFAATGRLDLLVSQNVDGLHERSGFPVDRLVNIHGTDAAAATGYENDGWIVARRKPKAQQDTDARSAQLERVEWGESDGAGDDARRGRRAARAPAE